MKNNKLFFLLQEWRDADARYCDILNTLSSMSKSWSAGTLLHELGKAAVDAHTNLERLHEFGIENEEDAIRLYTRIEPLLASIKV